MRKEPFEVRRGREITERFGFTYEAPPYTWNQSGTREEADRVLGEMVRAMLKNEAAKVPGCQQPPSL